MINTEKESLSLIDPSEMDEEKIRSYEIIWEKSFLSMIMVK